MTRFILFLSACFLGLRGISALTHDVPSALVYYIDGLDRCFAVDTTLKVTKFLKTMDNVPSFSICQQYCRAFSECTHVQYDYRQTANKKCSFIGLESFGYKNNYVITGFGECPKADGGMNIGEDYNGGRVFSTTGVETPQECQEFCRTKKEAVAFEYGFTSDQTRCSCKKMPFQMKTKDGLVAGGLSSLHCFGYDHDLDLLQNVDTMGDYTYLALKTAADCQKTCEENDLCSLFQFVLHKTSLTKNHCFHKNERTAEQQKKNVAYASRYCDISCNCNPKGVKNGDTGCDHLGQCSCNEEQGYTGRGCFECKPGFVKEGTLCQKVE